MQEEIVPGGILLKHSLSLNIKIQWAAKKEWVMKWDDVVLKPSWVQIKKTKQRALSDAKPILYLDKSQTFNRDIDIVTSWLNSWVVTKKWAFLKYWELTLWQGILSTIANIENKEIFQIIKEETIDMLDLNSTLDRLYFWKKEARQKYNDKALIYNKKWNKEIWLLDTTVYWIELNTLDRWDPYNSLDDIIDKTKKSDRTIKRWVKEWKIIEDNKKFYILNNDEC